MTWCADANWQLRGSVAEARDDRAATLNPLPPASRTNVGEIPGGQPFPSSSASGTAVASHQSDVAHLVASSVAPRRSAISMQLAADDPNERRARAIAASAGTPLARPCGIRGRRRTAAGRCHKPVAKSGSSSDHDKGGGARRRYGPDSRLQVRCASLASLIEVSAPMPRACDDKIVLHPRSVLSRPPTSGGKNVGDRHRDRTRVVKDDWRRRSRRTDGHELRMSSDLAATAIR